MRKLLVVLAALGFVGLWYYALMTPRDNTPDAPLVGRPGPTFALQQLNGNEQKTLESYSGQPVMLNFWASWCTVCKIEAKMLQAAHVKYGEKGLKVLGIAIQDKPENARRFANSHGKTYELLLDPEGAVAVDYGVFGVPETFFLDQDGVIQDKIVGEVTQEKLDASLRKLGFGGAVTAGTQS